MEAFKRVLLLTNSTTEAEIALIKTAFAHARHHGIPIQLNLAHVIPHLPSCYFNIPSMVVIAERYYEEAKKALTVIAQELNIPQHHQWLITGRIKTETLHLAQKLNAQFILAGSAILKELHPTPAKETQTLHIQNISSVASLA